MNSLDFEEDFGRFRPRSKGKAQGKKPKKVPRGKKSLEFHAAPPRASNPGIYLVLILGKSRNTGGKNGGKALLLNRKKKNKIIIIIFFKKTTKKAPILPRFPLKSPQNSSAKEAKLREPGGFFPLKDFKGPGGPGKSPKRSRGGSASPPEASRRARLDPKNLRSNPEEAPVRPQPAPRNPGEASKGPGEPRKAAGRAR